MSTLPRTGAPALEAITPGADKCGVAVPEFPVLFAYIDPGTGSYVLQLALAGLLGAGYTIRRFWGRIAALFGRPATPLADDAKR